MKTILITGLTCFCLLTNLSSANAAPGNAEGGKRQSQNSGQTYKKQQNSNYKGQKSSDSSKRTSGKRQALSIDAPAIRNILDDSRDYWGSADTLPPGIRKNLERGKPLPPGIAKKLDGRLQDRLPRYEGYEWRRCDTDLVLVSSGTDIVHDIIDRAFVPRRR